MSRNYYLVTLNCTTTENRLSPSEWYLSRLCVKQRGPFMEFKEAVSEKDRLNNALSELIKPNHIGKHFYKIEEINK